MISEAAWDTLVDEFRKHIAAALGVEGACHMAKATPGSIIACSLPDKHIEHDHYNDELDEWFVE